MKYAQLNKIFTFNSILNKFNYGKLVNNKITIDPVDFNDYVTISPYDFVKYKTGVCWDYAEFEAFVFNKFFKNVPHQLYYIEGNNGGATHTWLVFYLNDLFWIFESSWKTYQGLTGFETIEELLYYYVDLFTKDFDIKRCVIYKYSMINHYCLTPDEFMKEIFTNGKLIININNYYEDVIKPWEDSNFTNMGSYEKVI